MQRETVKFSCELDLADSR